MGVLLGVCIRNFRLFFVVFFVVFFLLGLRCVVFLRGLLGSRCLLGFLLRSNTDNE
jgi:hypothetical protein